MKGKDESHEVLHHRARDKRDHDGNENPGDDCERFGTVDVGGDFGEGRPFGNELHAGSGEGASQKLKDDRHRGGGRKPQGVKRIKQNNVSHHHGKKDQHDFGEAEHLRMKDAASGDFHHARRKGGAEHDACGRDPHRGAERGNAAA